MPFSWAPVTALRWQPEAADRVALGVKLDEDRRLGPRDPRVVSRLDRDDLRRHDLECTAVPVPPLHATAGEEADVRVHAVLRADNGSDVRRPAEAWRVDDPLHPAVGSAHDVELDARDHAVLCASDGRRQRVPRPTQRPAARGRCRTRPGRSPRALHPRLPGLTSADRRHAPAQDPGEQLGVEAGPDQLDALVEALAVRADPGALELEDADAPAGGSTISALAVMAASESATANRPLRETTGHAITSRRSYLPGVTRSTDRDAAGAEIDTRRLPFAAAGVANPHGERDPRSRCATPVAGVARHLDLAGRHLRLEGLKDPL